MADHLSSRITSLSQLMANEPAFRMEQIRKAFYQPEVRAWQDISTLPAALRGELETIPFLSVSAKTVASNTAKDTYKAILTLQDGHEIESVLMRNRRESWTICVSSQVGCAMRCGFCATGLMGFTRNLLQEEIADQYRFWNQYVADHFVGDRISNVVFMGMGEPLANYDAVKGTINEWLQYTDLGNTRITVSTVGMLPRLEQILEDETWPHVRLAISLHSAEVNTRKEIVPTSYPDFLAKLSHWAKRYLEKFGNKRHHLTFEYVMLNEKNDSEEQARILANYVNRIGDIKVNLIPYNLTDNPYTRSKEDRIEAFVDVLKSKGVRVTVRQTMGEDIAAACGQLIKLGQTRVKP